jgi:cyclophilin family peptidyl-prolyl cis-trans isomerase
MLMNLRPFWADMGIGLYWQLMAVWFVAAALMSCSASGPGNPKVPKGAKSSGGKQARIETEMGNITIEFYEDESPTAVENFRLLAEHGYYDGLTFHRVVEGFMIQGGDPRGDGTGGESAWGGDFDDDIDGSSTLYRRGYRRGIVAMANAGPDTNGSQFFIMHGNSRLQPNYVIFGNVVEGLPVVDALASVPTARSSSGEMSRPTRPLVIRKVQILP